MLRSRRRSRQSARSARYPGEARVAEALKGADGAFRSHRAVSPEPLLRGDGLYLRPATPADFSAWTRLRGGEPGDFSEPWEPTWPDDDLTRAAFRRRLRRQAEDIARDESFLPYLRPDLRRIARRHHVRRHSARRRAVGNAGLLDGRAPCRQGPYDARGRGDCAALDFRHCAASDRGGLHAGQHRLG